jgi:hypothetical protein
LCLSSNILTIFEKGHIAEHIACYGTTNFGGQIMSISSLPSTLCATDIKEGFIPTEIRAFIAGYIGVDAEHITDAMHFLDDGAR